MQWITRTLASSFKSLQDSGATDAMSGAWAYETATALTANSRSTLFMLISSFFTVACGLGMCLFLWDAGAMGALASLGDAQYARAAVSKTRTATKGSFFVNPQSKR